MSALSREELEALFAALPAGAVSGMRERGSFVLAVSGGRDSMLLLRLFAEMRDAGFWKSEQPQDRGAAPEVAGTAERVVVFHLNHGLRPEAERDLDLVVSECARLGFPVYYETRDVVRFARRVRLGLEEAGRRLRYRYLARLCAARPGAVAVTAHHADDYLESLLMHLARGGGPRALSTLDVLSEVEGVPVFRPLLGLNRERIDELCRRLQVPYHEDETNADTKFRRNRFRARIVPHLKEEGLDSVKLWRNFHPDPAVILPRSDVEPDRLELDRALFAGANGAELKALLDLAMARLGLPPVERALIEELGRMAPGRSEFRLIYQTARFLIWSGTAGPVHLIRADSALHRPFVVMRSSDSWSSDDRSSDTGRVVIHYNNRDRRYKLTSDQEVIAWRPGLRLVSAREGEAKKVKNLFQSLRLPPPVRKNLPLIVDAGRGRVVRVCLGFWTGEADLLFPTPRTGTA